VRQWRVEPGLALSTFGGLLLVASLFHHATEISVIDEFSGPILAFILDGLPPLLLVVAGLRLRNSDLQPNRQWQVVLWCLAAAAVFAAATSATFLVREFEGRETTEPTFPLLVSTGMGAVAGFLAGYFNATAHEDARRARRTSEALAFVNDVLRHDIRNNLGIIRGNASAVDSETTDDVREFTETIRQQTDASVERIESASAIADTIVGAGETTTVDLAAIAESVADRVDDAFAATVTTSLPESARVRANEGLQSVVSNLVENAAEHNDAENPTVEVRVTTDGDVARLTVADNGPGVPSDLLQGESPSVEDGGLYLVEALVDRYDGELTVESPDSRGSVFVVELPRADGEEEDKRSG
jgi:two-component system OmpR family sensor kinase